jgi:two-component system, sensor histidine kinase
MLVDDDPGAASVVSWILKQNHYSVRYFRVPINALKEFNKNATAFDAIIVDVRMPVMNGFEFARRIRKICTEIRIILLTDFAVSKAEFRKVFPSLQIDDIVVKPTTPAQLLQAVSGMNNSKPSHASIGNGGARDYQKAL